MYKSSLRPDEALGQLYTNESTWKLLPNPAIFLNCFIQQCCFAHGSLDAVLNRCGVQTAKLPDLQSWHTCNLN